MRFLFLWLSLLKLFVSSKFFYARSFFLTFFSVLERKRSQLTFCVSFIFMLSCRLSMTGSVCVCVRGSDKCCMKDNERPLNNFLQLSNNTAIGQESPALPDTSKDRMFPTGYNSKSQGPPPQ